MSPHIIEAGSRQDFSSYAIDLHDKPQRTIYLLIQQVGPKETVVYVGQSETNFFNRLNSHIIEDSKTFNRVFAFNLEDYGCTLDQVEHALITYYQPIYNKCLKGDVTKLDFQIMRYFINNFDMYINEGVTDG